MKTRTIMAVATTLVVAAAAFAAVSPDKADWAKGPVQFLMTPEELTRWNALQTDAEADEFVSLFWLRRDPTPGTPANEFREDFEARAAYADQNFSTKTVRGATSDRGKMLILFGAPTRAVRSGGAGTIAPTSPASTFGGRTTDAEAEDTRELAKLMWTYDGATAQKMFGAPRVELRFLDRRNDRNMRLETPTFDLAGAQRRVIAAAITQPNITSVPAARPTVPAAPQAAAPANALALKTAALEAAVANAKSGAVPPKGATVTYAEFMSPTGTYYAPLGLFVPGTSGVAADAADTFFGVIEDASGKRVDAFEVPAKGTLSKKNLLYDHTLNLPSGTYTATLGLAKAGAPVLMTSGPITLNSVAKDTRGTSRLVLSDVIETMEAAPVMSPFAFGRLKIVPRAAFTNKDELGYFIEIHNPGVDPTTNLPKLQAKIDLVPPSGPTISAPLSDVQALPLSGAAGPGEYALISGIPLGDMAKPLAPGDYTLRIKLVDTVTKQSYTVEQKFKIVS